MPRRESGAPRPRVDEWELHRRQISRLFTEKKMTYKDIANYMKIEHGFDMKVKDYDYRFKKWNLRRNFHKTELRSIHSHLSRRKQAGRPSEIVVSGSTWSESIILGRLDRHQRLSLPGEQMSIDTLPHLIARVQTPSLLMSDVPEWPKELPWLQFNLHFRQALSTLTADTVARPLFRPPGQQERLIQLMRPYINKPPVQQARLIEMMRPYINKSFLALSYPQGDNCLHPRRRMRAVLEVIAPQIHEGDHETTAEIFHTGSQSSLAAELVRLFIYLEANNMSHQIEAITGCNVDLFKSENMMDFLRRIGFLTKANIDWLGRSTDNTSQVFLGRLLDHSISDANSLDVLGWLIPNHFDVNHFVQSPMTHWRRVAGHGYMRESVEARNHNYSRNLLQASSFAGNIHAVRLLLDLGADPYGTSIPQDYSPLECAASLRDHNRAAIIVDWLLSKQTRSSSEFQKEALEGALRLAIVRSHAELISRLLWERKRLGHGTICSQHLTIAAKNADRDTMSLLVDEIPRESDGSIPLPKDILFATISGINRTYHLDLLIDKFTYLLEIGADPKTLRCEHGCRSSFILYYVIGRSLQFGRLAEDYAMKLAEVLKKYECPSETPKSISGKDAQPSALQAAIYRGYPRLVEYLLGWDVNIDHYQGDIESQTLRCGHCNYDGDWMSGLKGRSPLLTALAHGRTDIAKMLCERNPNLKLRGGEQKLAMKAGDDTELVTMLLKAGSEDMEEWKDFLEQAILRQNPRSASLLLSNGHDYHATIDPETMLRAFMLVGHQDTAYAQIAVCKYDSRALFEAVSQSYERKDHQRIVERLLETRPNISNDGFEVLAVISAAIYQDMSLLGVLMKALGQGPWIAPFPDRLADDKGMFLSRWVPDDDDEPGTPAHILDYAADLNRCHNDDTVLKSLLEVNIPAEGMKIAISYDLTAETWKALIAGGADPKDPDLLFSAVETDMLAHVEVLCEAQAPVNTMHGFKISDSDYHTSRTAVQLAVEIGSPEMLQMLIRYGGDVDHPAGWFYGATCLQLASKAGNIGLVRLLLAKGAKVNARRSLICGRTSIEFAAENGKLDVLKLLLLQDEQLYQTTAERYQFIRATKMAMNNSHGVINKILREHIHWNSEDQRLFDEIQGSTYLTIHLDAMTEMLLESEKGDRELWTMVDEIIDTINFEDLDDTLIQSFGQWLGESAEETSDRSTTAGTECSSEGEDSMTPENAVATGQFCTATQEIIGSAGEPTSQAEPQSDLLQREEVFPGYEDIHDALVEPTDLQGDLTGQQSARQWHVWKVNSETDRSTQTSAPHALRHHDKNPVWLEMEENEIDDMMQDLSGGLVTRDRTWGALAHRPAIQNVDREAGMVLEEVLDDVPYINDMDDNAIDHNEVGDIGEAEDSHMQQFNWGLWDDESFSFHSAAWENQNIGSGSAG